MRKNECDRPKSAMWCRLSEQQNEHLITDHGISKRVLKKKKKRWVWLGRWGEIEETHLVGNFSREPNWGAVSLRPILAFGNVASMYLAGHITGLPAPSGGSISNVIKCPRAIEEDTTTIRCYSIEGVIRGMLRGVRRVR